MEMVEMGMGKQHQIDAGQIPDPHARAFDAFEQEKPVGKVWIYQDIQVIKLDEKRRVANPGYGHLAVSEPGENRTAGRTRARREPGLPDQLLKKSSRIEMFCRG